MIFSEIWGCVGKLNHKNLPIKSLAFSSDGSLLAVGHGNVLCVYCTETLFLKCALSTPLDGVANRFLVNLPTSEEPKSPKEKRNNLERKKKIFQSIKLLLETSDDKKFLADLLSMPLTDDPEPETIETLTVTEQQIIFKRIMSATDLNFYQKLELFRRLNVHCKSNEDIAMKFKTYVVQNLGACQLLKRDLFRRSKALDANSKYDARRKLDRLKLSVDDDKWLSEICRFGDDFDVNVRKAHLDAAKGAAEKKEIVQCMAQIVHVAFSAGDYSHLVS